MDCPKCNLRYNTINRKPQVHQCGHTICEFCSKKIKLCHICQVVFDHSKSTINHSLLEMLRERKTAIQIDKLIKVCFVGESKVGKTSLINRLKGEDYRQNTIPTIGYDFAFETRQVSGLNIRFQLWDSAGQERYRSISPLHYKNSDIIVIVYDMTEDANNNKIEQWLEEANLHCPEQTIKILVGNKIDLLDQMEIKLINPIDPHTWKIVAAEKIANYHVSCKTYEGIQEFWAILENTVKSLLKRVVVKSNPFRGPQEKTTPAIVTNDELRKNQGAKLKTSGLGSFSRSWCPC